MKVIVGVDGSRGAEEALRWTASFVLAHPGSDTRFSLRLVHAWQPPKLLGVELSGLLGDQGWEDDALDLVREAKRAVIEMLGSDRDQFDIDTATLTGPPASSLIDEADRVDADLVVVGTRGLTGLPNLLLGNVSRRVAANGDRAVAIVPEETPVCPAPVAVGFDNSDGAQQALLWAQRHFGEEIRPTIAWYRPHQVAAQAARFDDSSFERAAEEQLLNGVRSLFGGSVPSRMVPLVVHGDPREILTRSSDVAAIVVGATRERVPRLSLLGSVTNAAVRQGRSTVVVVPASS